MKRYYHEITIKPVDNGFIAQVGCVTAVFQEKDINDLTVHLNHYLQEPEEAEKEWMRKHRHETPEPTINLDDGQGQSIST